MSTTSTAAIPAPQPPAEPPSRRRIEVQDLVKVFRGRPVVNGVSLNVNQGEVVGLLGPNGAGKTTTFYMVVGLERPTGGRVYLDGQDVTHMPMYRRARLGVGYLAQEASVFRKMTARENLMLVLELVGYPADRRRARADTLLEELRIAHIADNRGYSLSGGERRRVEIARALAADPSFLLLDEPFTGIDPITREEIGGIIRDLRDQGLGILITDHDERTTLRLTDRAYIMYDGKVVTQGSAESIAADPVARKFYLGETFEL